MPIQATTHPQTEVYDLMDDMAHVLVMNSALALKVDKSCVDGQLVLKAKQATTYTMVEVANMLVPKAIEVDVDIELAKKANLSEHYHRSIRH